MNDNVKRKKSKGIKKGIRKTIKKCVSIFVLAIMIITGMPANSDSMVIVSEAAGYSADSAVAYAQKHAFNYNPNFASYADNDCANFVSQCLEAGGIKRDGTWYPGSLAWNRCDYMISYFSSLGYKVIYYPSASEIKLGNPVFTSSSHVMICTGKRSDGTPLLSGHTNDRLDLPVYSYYCTIMINGGDNTAPAISNISIKNITSSGYTVQCTVTDNNSIKEVRMPTWTNNKGQDDIIWHTAALNRSADGKSATATFDIKISEHNYEAGEYTTHIYAYDNAGNSTCNGCGIVNVPMPPTSSNVPTLSVSGHVQYAGWKDSVSNGQVMGTTGKSLRLEALKISFAEKPPYSGDISYRGHVQSIGWQDWQSNGAIAGTTGKSLRLEAIQIKLTGKLAEKYDIYYRTHVQGYGWLAWACNGETSGTTGKSLRVEAIQVVIVPKDSGAPCKDYGGASQNKDATCY